MKDKIGRKIEYLRISITDRCNLRCVYCMPENGIQIMENSELLTFDEIQWVVKACASLGVSKIRITGGEPLARKNVEALVSKIKAVEGIEEVSMTTNGIFLNEQLNELVAAGLDRTNISLDTLHSDRYSEITRGGDLNKVLSAVEGSLKAGLTTKLNTVIIRDFNYDEIMDFVRLTETMPINVRFIELMPLGQGKDYKSISSEEIKKIILKQRKLEPYNHVKGYGPAVYYKTEKSKGSIGFISPLSHEFCDSCNRIRLTAEGFLKLCLHWNLGVDLKEALRKDCSQKELTEIIEKAVREKPSHHEFMKNNDDKLDFDTRKMVQIGG
jgi:cyclic pyranopterin phosphate synthase